MHLLYITFGEGINHHLQAAFSIYSFLVQKEDISSINVVTDAPEFYAHFQAPIRIIRVDAQTLQDWKGEHDFFWRIKIKAIEMVCGLYAGSPVMYLDTDTFCNTHIRPVRDKLLQGMAFMHEREGPLSKAKSKTEKKMWRQVKQNAFGGAAILDTDCMWNAGIVAFPNNRNKEECALALKICDEMCARGVTRRLIEQFALSVSLQRVYGLEEAGSCIGHYWSNKEEWNHEIGQFFSACYLKAYPEEKRIALMKAFDFRKLPVRKKIKTTRKRIEHFAAKAFPAKQVRFVDAHYGQ